MKNLSMNDAETNIKEILIKASIQEESYSISIPGAGNAIIISEQEYTQLKEG